MASFVEALTKALVCQVCRDHPRPGKRQWYLCKKRHPVCQECKTKREINLWYPNCKCGKPISEEYCKLTEKWLSVEDLKFKCANAKPWKPGCEEHESRCGHWYWGFHPYQVPGSYCYYCTFG